LALRQPPPSGRSRHPGGAAPAEHGRGAVRRSGASVARQARRTGVATAVVSTIGIAMVNTTGIAHSEPPQPTEIRPAGTTLAGTVPATTAGTTAVTPGGTDSLSDPSLADSDPSLADPSDPAGGSSGGPQDHELTRAEALAQLSLLLVQQRDSDALNEQQRIEATRWVQPIEARISQRFGGSNHHPGIDLAASYGTPIVAAHRGTVVYAGWMSGYGNFVQIMHENNVVTCYGHLSRILVRVGEVVDTGEQIGREGSTGYSTGPHLHFEVRLNGQNGTKVDPLAWLAGHGVTY
jgi:murein DD-endopeptidase MepM/ murein hydrolase activator NlpD